MLVFSGALLAGFLGSLTGIGGGIIITPLLVLALGVDIKYAIGASLVAAIATSSGAAAAFIKEGYTNTRIAMFLEIATVTGALIGAAVAAYTPNKPIAVLFGIILLATAFSSFRKPLTDTTQTTPPSPFARKLKMHGTYPTHDGHGEYWAIGIPAGFGIMGLAGVLSGLLGIGSGFLKVLAMDRAMKLPFKVSTATSNFMIGVTAAAGAGVYLQRGYIDPAITMPVLLGVLGGSLTGARFLHVANVRLLRILFLILLVFAGLQMIYKGLSGHV